MTVPYVIEKGPKDQERVYDLFSRLLKDRIIFIRDEFNSQMADSVIAQLLFLETDDPEADIHMYINSPGGSASAMLAIFDVMKYIKPAVSTLGMGQCMSAASFILAAGTKGKRFALPNTDIMIHELSTGTQGKYKDIKNYMKHTDRLHEKVTKYYSEITGKPLARIKKDMEIDNYMSAEEAVEYGLIDKILYKRV